VSLTALICTLTFLPVLCPGSDCTVATASTAALPVRPCSHVVGYYGTLSTIEKTACYWLLHDSLASSCFECCRRCWASEIHQLVMLSITKTAPIRVRHAATKSKSPIWTPNVSPDAEYRLHQFASRRSSESFQSSAYIACAASRQADASGDHTFSGNYTAMTSEAFVAADRERRSRAQAPKVDWRKSASAFWKDLPAVTNYDEDDFIAVGFVWEAVGIRGEVAIRIRTSLHDARVALPGPRHASSPRVSKRSLIL
jgi:hypothetical protein